MAINPSDRTMSEADSRPRFGRATSVVVTDPRDLIEHADALFGR
jgi:hypothetical protein